MSRSFDRLIEFFSLEEREKEAKVEEIFQETLEFFKYFKHIQAVGSDEERKSVQEKLKVLQEKFKQEADETMSDMKLSQDQVKEIASQKEHFSDKQWSFLQSVKSVYNEQKESFVNQKQKIKEASFSKVRKVKKKKASFGRQRGLKS